MFTGIIEHLGTVASVEPGAGVATLRIDAGRWSHTPQPGESIAINGCCLTVAPDGADGTESPSMLRFDVVPQTLRLTTLGLLKPGDQVNLEHAVTSSTLMGGHIVQGHIDGVGVVMQLINDRDDWRMRIEPPHSLMDLIVDKGSIAVHGVSLTVACVGASWFEVALIPTTLKLTNLSGLRAAAKVNLEADYIAKTVVNWLKRNQCS
jgi:riboflavin synthase